MHLRAAISLFVLSLIFPAAAFYDDPPIANVTNHNLALAASLNEYYSPSIGANGTILMEFNGTDKDWVEISRQFNFMLMHASVKLLAMVPAVDNAISPSEHPVLLLVWGAKAENLPSKDYENDDCNESQVSYSLSRSAIVNFTFCNVSEVVIAADNVVPVPDLVLSAMENSSGRDALQVQVNATFIFNYTVNDRKAIIEGGCADRIKTFSSSISVNDSASWIVEGNRTLFFLRAPVLGEQWFRNNRFDSILFSNSRIYAGSVSGPGSQSNQFRLCAFDIANDSYGIWHMFSIPLQSGHDGIAGYNAMNTPIQLSHDNFTYAYLYEFNYSYQGLGENLLTLEAQPIFGANKSFQQELLSRMLTHSGNITELGTAAGYTFARPSASFSIDSIKSVAPSLGLIGVLLAALVLNRMRWK